MIWSVMSLDSRIKWRQGKGINYRLSSILTNGA